MTIRNLLYNVVTMCEVEVYSERRGTLIVDAYDNNVIMVVIMIHSYIAEYLYDTCRCKSTLKQKSILHKIKSLTLLYRARN